MVNRIFGRPESEDRRQKTEDRGQRSEVRRQKREVRSQDEKFAGTAGWRLLSAALFLLLFTTPKLWAIERQRAAAFTGQDLHLVGRGLLSYQFGAGEHVLVFQGGFSMTIGATELSSDKAVVWLEGISREYRGTVRIDYEARAYLRGNVSVKRGKAAKTTDLAETVIEAGQALVARFLVTGEVFATADKREIADPRGLELYEEALAATAPTRFEPTVHPEAVVPRIPEPVKVPAKPEAPPAVRKEVRKSGLAERIFAQPKKPAKIAPKPKGKRVAFQYPVNIAGAGEVSVEIEKSTLADGSEIATVIGRFYLWQQLDERGNLLELQADSAVIFFVGGQVTLGEERPVQAVYLCGDIVMTEGLRTVRADEIYYDFQQRKALAVNAVMRTFDVERGIPIYVRADKLRQVAQNRFAARNVTLTSSEFYLPQVSLNASSVIVTDTTGVDAEGGKLSKSSYDAEIHDLRLKLGQSTWFYWPYMRSNLERPDVPVKSMHISHDNTWGTAVETRWHLSRLLGLREPEGVDSTLALDVFSKRGFGAGAEIKYSGEDYFGKVQGYIIRDTGEDRLGRASDRKDLAPPRELRGRFRFQHRQFLPYNWQLTLETSYNSDENFLESFYRNEFNTGKEQESIVHLKRLQDNWALAFLGKWRMNDFVNNVEELPGAEFHWTGQSLFEDRFTFYSDSQIGRFRNRPAGSSLPEVSGKFFSFLSTRNELDMPIQLGRAKVVPYIAGTFAIDDGPGFTAKLDDTTSGREDDVWLGELGVRAATEYWKVFDDFKSRLWDVSGLRHIIKPQVTAAVFEPSDSVIDQRDTLSVAVLQRWQTKRGPAGDQRTIDWMRLNTEFTWVKDSRRASDAGPGPDRFIWNRPFIPLTDRLSKSLTDDFGVGLSPFARDRRSTGLFGPRRNYFAADYIWRITDTTTVLSDINYDMQSGVVQQFNVGLARLRWPNLSYYIGSRYLRRVEVLDEVGSHAFTFAATYMLNDRYTLVFAQQYDFDYGANLRSDITLIRRYHRIYWGLTYSADESLDRRAIIFSIWPQGIPELAIGPRRYIGLAGAAGYD